MSLDFVSRLVGMAVLGYTGWEIASELGSRELPPEYAPWTYSLVLAGIALGLLITPYVTIRPIRWVGQQFKQLPANVLFSAVVGLVIGLIISALLAVPLSLLPGYLGKFLPIATSIVMGYLGITLMVIRERDLLQAASSYIPGLTSDRQNGRVSGEDKLILDTSAIIDGRIADIGQTGFLRGTLVIPRFILDELRHIADSPDSLKRNRGRRGLEMLNRLQKETNVPLQILDTDFADVQEVDAKLVKLGKMIKAPIITNDFNLNRVAELQGVHALNINELANAVKSIVLPGEEMYVRIIQEGKESGQGVGFLDDGTMVVVENGKRYLNEELNIIVTRVLQTIAGRMIFAQPKD